MSASISNSSLARSRSLRSNTLGSLKPLPPTASSQPVAGPSNLTLFLTNLRLLDLDVRDDWPDITALSLSTKGAKKRIQCVEWALYQLFMIWDPEEARYKLQPFFPPLEPLQSLNLRAALFRCLEQAKKAGVLGRDILLRKTMLDECKGERLEEVLAVMSNAVLKKVLQESEAEGHKALAQLLALENFSYSGERTVLSALILAHKASLGKHLREKEGLRAQYNDFTDLLNLNDRRISRRQEQLRQMVDDRDDQETISTREVRALQDTVQENWSGADGWSEAIIHGDSRINTDGVLGTPFDKVWNCVESGTIGDLEGKKHAGLLEQLEERVQGQEARLARWQDFGKTLPKNGPVSPSKPRKPTPSKPKKIDLGFNRHQELQIIRGDAVKKLAAPSSLPLDDYTRMVENMQAELADVAKPRVPVPRSARQSLTPLSPHGAPMASPQVPNPESPTKDEEWSSASESEEAAPMAERCIPESASHAPPSSSRLGSRPSPQRSFRDSPVRQHRPDITLSIDSISLGESEEYTPSPKIEPHAVHSQPRTAPAIFPPVHSISSEVKSVSPPIQSKPSVEERDLADEILNSVAAASPSPKKPRHTLSLAERTRLSMSRASHSKYSEDEFDSLGDMRRLSIKPQLSQPTREARSSEPEKHADLIERTRQSMAGFEAAQQKAQISRRRSVKEAQKKQRESSYFPRVEEEPLTPSVDAAELIEGDPDYADVFKSRPKIATSPAVSPTRWDEDDEVF